MYDIVIVGRNVSALTAVLYAAMSKKSMLHITCPSEIHTAMGVNRYLGNIENTYEAFYANTCKQLKKFRYEEANEDMEGAVVQDGIVKIKTKEREIEARTIIIATEEGRKITESAKDINGDANNVFVCGTALEDNTELIALASTGAKAAIDARMYLD